MDVQTSCSTYKKVSLKMFPNEFVLESCVTGNVLLWKYFERKHFLGSFLLGNIFWDFLRKQYVGKHFVEKTFCEGTFCREHFLWMKFL